MARLPDPDGALAAALLHHAALGGDLPLAARAGLTTGGRGRRMAGPAEADKAASRGLQLLEHLPPEVRLELEIPLLRVAVFARIDRRARRDLDVALSRAILTAQAAGRSDQQTIGFHLLATIAWREQNFARAEETTLRAAEVATASDPATHASGLATTSRCLALLERSMPRAVAMAFEARAVADRHGLEVPEVYWALSTAHHFRGDVDAARVAGEQAVVMYQKIDEHWPHAMCLIELAMIEFECGRLAEARRFAEQAIPVTEKLGAGSEGPFALALAALIDYAEARPDAAARLDRALAALEEVDARSLLAYALDAAAELDLAAGRHREAERRAQRALIAAQAVERGSEIARARALLLKIARSQGDRAATERLAAALTEDPPDEAAVGARAKRLVEESLRTKRRSA
jgi:tetratricopeptide (TPR) repeat protein